MANLPDDILRQIFSYLPQSSLLQCRVLCHSAEPLASALAFRHVRLNGDREPLSFVRISECERLAAVVREMTINVCESEFLDILYLKDLKRYVPFLLAIPRLRLFPALQVLNIRFTAECAETSPYEPEKDIPTTVLSAIFKVITGQWTEGDQVSWEQNWQLDPEAILHNLSRLTADLNTITSNDNQIESSTSATTTPFCHPLPLHSVTITNLPDTITRDFYLSDAFQTFASSHQPLRNLKLLVANRNNLEDRQDYPFFWEKYELYENLPSTWLSPPLAAHLRVLTLYNHDYFGWTPKLDLRLVNHTAGFPNLRVLALGRFVLSHAWQIDWVASLGAQNGRGGLQELYLDDCPILWRAHTYGPLDESTVQTTAGTVLSNVHYPLREVMTKTYLRREMIEVNFDLRWGEILDTWREKMKNLQVFKMGSGDWGDRIEDSYLKWDRMSSNGQENEGHLESSWRFPCMPTDWLNEDRKCVLQYVQFNVALSPEPWIERDFKHAMMDEYDDNGQHYEACLRKDEEALDRLLEVVRERAQVPDR